MSGRKWHVVCWTVPAPVTIIELQSRFSFLSENKCSRLFWSLIEGPGELMKDDIANDLEWPLSHFSCYKRLHCPYLDNTAYAMYEVNYTGRMSYVRCYFYCHIWPEILLYDAESNLLAIAKFPVDFLQHSKVKHTLFTSFVNMKYNCNLRELPLLPS